MWNAQWSRLILVAGLGLLVAPAAPTGEQGGSYLYTVLPDVPSAKATNARHMNAHGELVGSYLDAANRWHGYVSWGDRFETIDVAGATMTHAWGINERGDIVGDYVVAGKIHGFLLSDGEYATIDVPEANQTRPWDINAHGEVGGEYQATVGGAWVGFTWRDEQFTSIDVPDAIMSAVYSISERGDVIGHYTMPGTKMLGFRMSEGVFTYFDYPFTYFSEYPDGFTGKPAAYGMSCAQGIGETGEVVGHYKDLSNGIVYGYVWRAGEFTTLQVPGARETYATSITASGVISGYHIDLSGATHAFIAESLNPAGR